MDIFCFPPITGPLNLAQGKLVEPLKSVMWIERYRDAGEFTIKARLDSGAREKLPIGSIISHIDTPEVMIVENHEISDSKDSDVELTITGRSFETFLENRIVGANQAFPNAAPYPQVLMPPEYTWLQVMNLINNNITVAGAVDDNDALTPVTAAHNIVGLTGESLGRVLKRTDLYSVVLELMEIDQLGIATLRPGTWPMWGGVVNDLKLMVHRGADRSTQIVFSHDTGDIDNADYLFTNKNLKNAVLVTGRWVEVVIKGPETNYNRRWMFVDASDIDNPFPSAPTGADLTNVRNAMTVRGNQALSAYNGIAIANAQASANLKRYSYRQDFNVGDLVTVSGEFDQNRIKRVIEYVEIEDETGESGYPTLSEP